MKLLTLALFLSFSFTSFAEECSGKLHLRLKSLINNNYLIKSENRSNNHKKLIDHDYPVSCKSSYKKANYIIFTDKIQNCLIIKKIKGKKDEYIQQDKKQLVLLLRR